MKSLSSLFLLLCFTANAINLSAGEPAAASFVLPSAQRHARAYIPTQPTLKHAVETADGQVVLTPQQVKKFKTLQHHTEDAGNTINLPQITTKGFALTVACVGDINRVNDLAPENLLTVMKIADMLEAPNKVRQAVAEKLIKYLNTLSPKEQEIVFDNFSTTIKNLFIKKKYGYPSRRIEEILESQGSFVLDLSNYNLDSLEGIELLSSPNTKILLLNNNNLRKLDLQRVRKAFPNIRQIDASHNKITVLTKQDIGALSSGLRIFLNNNRINTAQQRCNFKTPEGVYIDIQDNPLTSSALDNLSHSLGPSFYQRAVDYPITKATIDSGRMNIVTLPIVALTLSLCEIPYRAEPAAASIYIVGLCFFYTQYKMYSNAYTPSFKQSTIELSSGTSYVALKMKEQRQQREQQKQEQDKPASLDELD